MGCAQSKIDNEESVSRCKDRRNLMKEVVTVRNLFASAHSGYSVSLKDTGAALSDYAQGEVPPPPLETAAPADPPAPEEPPPPPPPPMPPMESNLPPPPPPLPSFSPMTPVTPLQRSVTMPAEMTRSDRMNRKMKGIVIEENDDYEEEEEEEEEEKDEYRLRKKGVEELASMKNLNTPDSKTPPEIRGMAWDYFFMDNNIGQPSLEEVEEEGEEEEEYEEERNGSVEMNFGNVGGNVDFTTPKKQQGGVEEIEEFKTPEPMSGATEKQFMHSNTAPPALSRVGFTGGSGTGKSSGVDILKILSDIDDHFLKASQSSQEVSKMLEATRLHYHSNFADNRAHIDHAARVMQVITWNKSFRGAANGNGANDNVGVEDLETHATVLDKLLAWEKKLYEEVKTGELMKLEYQRKVSVLNKLKKRNASSEQLEKAKAAVSHLHTRYIVDMQSLDSTVSEVNDIRDKQLYPKLVALVHGMRNMWESMCTHHDSQYKIVIDLKSLDVSGLLIETTKHHHERTKQLANVIDRWLSEFEKLVSYQRQYINTLNAWLKLNLIPTESSLREKVSSPPRASNPPIQPLLVTWHDHLEKLPDEVAKNAISSFGAVIKTIIIHQEEEMKSKEKHEETRREYLRKKQAFEDWFQKYTQRRGPHDETDPDKITDANAKDPAREREFAVDSLKKRLDEEIEHHQKLCIQVREKSAGNLKIRLPELFRALSDYAHACFDAYDRLRWLTQSQHLNKGA